MTIEASPNQKAASPLAIDELQTTVINLDRRPDRLQAFQARLRKATGLGFAQRCRRFAAVDGMELVDTPELRHLFRNNTFDFRRAVIGAMLSHIGVWRDIAKQPAHQLTLIFEDDAVLPDALDRRLIGIVHELGDSHPDFDLAFLGYHAWDYVEPSDPTSSGRWLPMRWERFRGGTFAYLVSPAGALELIGLVQQHGVQDPVDWFQMRYQAELSALEWDPPLVWSPVVNPDNDADSDTQRNFATL